MKVYLSDNRTIFIDYFYEPQADVQFGKGLTTCQIGDSPDFIKKNKLPISVGTAECSSKDQFCKKTGREVAMSKALLSGPFTKAQRKEVWEAYRNQCKTPRW